MPQWRQLNSEFFPFSPDLMLSYVDVLRNLKANIYVHQHQKNT